MVAVGPEVVGEEQTVAGPARAALQGQRDQVAEPAGRQRVLAREEPVVRSEADVGVALHGFRQEMGAETARDRCRHRVVEDDPDMCAVARAGAFQGRRNPLRPAGCEKSRRVPPPGLPVEVGGEEPVGVVRADGIDADRVTTAQVPLDHFVRHGQEGLVGTGPALDLGFAAYPRFPFVAARRRIARPTRPGILPAHREYVLPAGEQGPEQRNLLRRRRPVGYGGRRPLAVRNGRSVRLEFREARGQFGSLDPEARKSFADAGGFLRSRIPVCQFRPPAPPDSAGECRRAVTDPISAIWMVKMSCRSDSAPRSVTCVISARSGRPRSEFRQGCPSPGRVPDPPQYPERVGARAS